MTNSRLKILFDIFLEPAGDEEDIRSHFISKGEDPDAIIERAKNIINQKEANIKLKIGKIFQNKAAELLKNLNETSTDVQDTSLMDNLGFAYRKQDPNNNNNDEELRNQAEKIEKLKKLLRGNDEYPGKS